MHRFLFFSSSPLLNILRLDFGGLVDARKDAMMDSHGREVIPTSFLSEDTTDFVVVAGLSRKCGGSFAFAQSVAVWR